MKIIACSAAAAVAVLGIVLMCSVYIVQPGTVAVPCHFGKVSENVQGEGIHLLNPFTTSIRRIDVKTQLASVKADASTKDLQEVSATVALNYSVVRDQAGEIVKTVGDGIYEKVILPIVMETFKAEAAKYTAEELITKRAELSGALVTTLSAQLQKRGICTEGVSITQFTFSARFNDAVEKKIVAEQEALQAKNELERVKVEAQKTEETARGQANAAKAKAEGEAEAIRITAVAQAEAIQSVSAALQGNRDVLMYQAIQKWDGKTPTHMLGETLPVFDVK